MCLEEAGICEYIEEVWEESRYTKPLEITGKFANDATIMKAEKSAIGRDETFSKVYSFSGDEKCDTSIWEERHLKLLGLDIYGSFNGKEVDQSPRVMMRHMSYVISMKDHELPYGDWLTLVFEAFGVPLVIKKGEEPKKYDFFEDTFLTMCNLTREDGIWWIGSGENRRRDDDEATPEEEAEGDDEGNKDDFGWEASDDQFYDAQVGEEEPSDETPATLAVQASSSAQQKDQEPAGVDPSGPTSREADFLKFQAEFERKRANRFHDELEKAKAENAKLLALLHKTQTKPHP
ncbi:hypothetical protein Dimus_005904 [Dionaea muscipula]